MLGKNVETDLTDQLSPIVADAGLYLEDIQVRKEGRYTVVRVVVDLPDGPGGVDSDQLDTVTRAVSAELDARDPLPGRYTLEVSTPGAERKLTTPRHFRRAQGRLVAATVAGKKVVGRVTQVADAGVQIGDTIYPIAALVDARVQLEFKRDDS